MISHTVGSHQLQEDTRRLIDQAVPGVAREMLYEVREGGDGDEICMDAEVLFLFLDEQSRKLRDFIRIARKSTNAL